METQQVKSDAKRLPSGRFGKGNNANPKGRKPGFASFVDRTEYLASRYTWGQCEDMCNDPKKLRALSSVDAMIIKRIYEGGLTGGGQSMDRLLNRVVGLPTQHVENTTTVNVMRDRIADAAGELSTEQLLAIKQTIEGEVEVVMDITPSPATDQAEE